MNAARQPVQTIGLIATSHSVTARSDLAELRQVLADRGAEAGTPDPVGVFVARVPATSREEALQTVFDAVAAAGADDHVAFLDHPDVPRHWRRWHVDSGEIAG